MARKHKEDEVLRALRQKGCTITEAQPIEKQVKDTIVPSESNLKAEYEKYLALRQKHVKFDVETIGVENAHSKWFDKFKRSNPELFVTKTETRTITLQAPYTVNINGANELGNKSWGKIDFLCNYKGFTQVNYPL